MSRVYTLTMHITVGDDEDFDVAQFLADHCNSHHHWHSHCPVGDMNCPFFETKTCSAVNAKDWDEHLTNYKDIKTS